MDIKNIHTMVFTIGRIKPDGISLLGTCFLIGKPNTVVTASHVTGNDDNNLVVCLPKVNIDGYQDTSDRSVRCIPARIVKTDPIHDICILECDLRGACSNVEIVGTDYVHPHDSLIIVGFPHCTHGRDVLTCQDATVGAKILIDTCGVKVKHIVINIQARDGQSGSPVFRESDSKLVAIIIGSYAPFSKGGISLGGIDPQTLHQTTHAVSAEYILKML